MSLFKKVSKVLGLVAISSLFAGSVFAMDAATKKQEMINSLQLTDTQKTSVETIMNDSHAQREKIMAMPNGPDKMKAIEDLHNDTQGKLKGTLTPEQFAKVETMQDEMFMNARNKMNQGQ
jgi:hypothetical protein